MIFSPIYFSLIFDFNIKNYISTSVPPYKTGQNGSKK